MSSIRESTERSEQDHLHKVSLKMVDRQLQVNICVASIWRFCTGMDLIFLTALQQILTAMKVIIRLATANFRGLLKNETGEQANYTFASLEDCKYKCNK